MNILVTIFFFGRSILFDSIFSGASQLDWDACIWEGDGKFTQLNLFHRSRSSLRFVLSVIYALVVYQIFERLLFFFLLRFAWLDWIGLGWIGLGWVGL